MAWQDQVVEFDAVLRRRKMVRAYTDTPIDPETIADILDAGRRTGAAGNTHGTSVMVLTTLSDRQMFWKCTGNAVAEPTFPWPYLRAAPLIILPLARSSAYMERYSEADKASPLSASERWRIPFWYLDSGFAIQNMLLAATNAGLGALFFGVFGDHVEAVRAAFHIPSEMELLGAITIGYPHPEDRPSRSAARGRPSPEAFITPHFPSDGSGGETHPSDGSGGENTNPTSSDSPT